MTQVEFESKLKAKIKKRRLLCLLIFVVFLALGVVCVFQFNNSLESGSNVELGCIWGITLGFVVSFVTGLLTLIDLIFWSCKTITVDDSFITVYRGMFGVALYIDGELTDKVHTRFRNYLEGQLKSGANVNVVLSSFSIHITFSNGHAPIDLDYITRD